MKKIKNVYLIDDAGTTDGLSGASSLTGKNYATGLVLEAVDGTLYGNTEPGYRPYRKQRFTPGAEDDTK